MPSFEDDTARLLEDLDAGFDSIVEPTSAKVGAVRAPPIPREERVTPMPFDAPMSAASSASATAARHQADMTEVRELFAGIAVAYARPVRDFMIEVAWGDPTRDWLDVALPATEALRRAAAAVELNAVDSALEGFQAALELALGEATIGGEVREMLSSSYARLVEALPAVFALEDERGRREPIIVRSLLMQVPGVRHVALEKLYRAGVNSLEVFYAAKPRELAETTGLDQALTTAIYERFQRYRREVAELVPARERAKERAELAALVDELSRHHEAHERATTSWSKDAAQKRIGARRERDAALVRIELYLARLGEVDLASAIAKLPFHQKIRELYRFLDEANQRSGR